VPNRVIMDENLSEPANMNEHSRARGARQ
jgi:hypothetical protein